MKKLLLRNHQSPGDICMLAYAIKCLHETYPGRFLTDFRGTSRELFHYNPYITPLDEKDGGVTVINAEYPLVHRSNEYPHHFIHAFVRDLETKLDIRIEFSKFQGFIPIGEEEQHWYSAVHEIRGEDPPYWIVNAGHKYDFTAKQWEYARYQQVADRFPETLFVQVGQTDHCHPRLEGDNVINLVGKTDTRQLIRLVYNSFGVITPVSFPMHLAYGVPAHPRFHRLSRACIVLSGGREPSHWQFGPNLQFLHTCGMLPCCDNGGCWKSRVVPLGDGDEKDRSLCLYPTATPSGQAIPKCMDMITVDEVCRKVEMFNASLDCPLPTSGDAGASTVACRDAAPSVPPERGRVPSPRREAKKRRAGKARS